VRLTHFFIFYLSRETERIRNRKYIKSEEQNEWNGDDDDDMCHRQKIQTTGNIYSNHSNNRYALLLVRIRLAILSFRITPSPPLVLKCLVKKCRTVAKCFRCHQKCIDILVLSTCDWFNVEFKTSMGNKSQ